MISVEACERHFSKEYNFEEGNDKEFIERFLENHSYNGLQWLMNDIEEKLCFDSRKETYSRYIIDLPRLLRVEEQYIEDRELGSRIKDLIDALDEYGSLLATNSFTKLYSSDPHNYLDPMKYEQGHATEIQIDKFEEVKDQLPASFEALKNIAKRLFMFMEFGE